MQDDFLAAFAEQRRLRAERDRTFEIEGVKLTHLPAVAPEVPLRFAEATDELAKWADGVNEILAKHSAEVIRIRAAAKNGDVPDLPETPELPEQPVSETELIAVYDGVILACLDAGSHDSWRSLRSEQAPYPLTGEDIYRLAVYLIGRATALPTEGLLGSSSTQPEIENTSKASSRSRARKPRVSAPS